MTTQTTPNDTTPPPRPKPSAGFGIDTNISPITDRPLRVGFVVPHIFMHRDILPQVIFSPGELALQLVAALEAQQNIAVTLFTPGPVKTAAHNMTTDLSFFEAELAQRGDSYLDLLKKHPFTFITLARQAQSELIAQAYAMADAGQLDIVHIYTNEEDIALPFAQFCQTPVVFTHHDPFNFLVKYRSTFPKYRHLNWLSMSLAQRTGMPPNTHWVGNIYHGLEPTLFTPNHQPSGDYIAYLGRIIEPKGVHLAIRALRHYNAAHPNQKLRLKLAGKHYAGHAKDSYWRRHIEPELAAGDIEYVGFIKTTAQKQAFLGNARALIVPSVFDEPFGMVMIEALACGTPVIGLDSGAIPEVITPGVTGLVVPKSMTDQISKHGHGPRMIVDEVTTSQNLAQAIADVHTIDRGACRAEFEARFTLQRMAAEHATAYRKLVR